MDIKIVSSYITFNVKGMLNYLVKVEHNGKEYSGLVKTRNKVKWEELLDYHLGKIELSENISILLNKFVDMSNYNSIYCETTNLKIISNANFTHFPYGLKECSNGYKINIDSKQCPEWDVIEIPEHIATITTKNGITYISNLKDDVTLVEFD